MYIYGSVVGRVSRTQCDPVYLSDVKLTIFNELKLFVLRNEKRRTISRRFATAMLPDQTRAWASQSPVLAQLSCTSHRKKSTTTLLNTDKNALLHNLVKQIFVTLIFSYILYSNFRIVLKLSNPLTKNYY